MNKFREIYNADIRRYGGNVGFYIRILLYLGRRASCTKIYFFKLSYKVLYRFWANIRGLEIASLDSIGGGLYIGHAYNITINPGAHIGANCNIHKGIVIGQTNRGKYKGVPKIGCNVWIGINAAIVGNITIGDDVLIAPNSFVNIDIPSHSVVFGNPCIIRPCEKATEYYINNY